MWRAYQIEERKRSFTVDAVHGSHPPALPKMDFAYRKIVGVDGKPWRTGTRGGKKHGDAGGCFPDDGFYYLLRAWNEPRESDQYRIIRMARVRARDAGNTQ